MTLDQLRIFLSVAQHLHFTRAAESLYITQSAVSAAIRNLEAECKAKLFHRIGRRISLTEAGNWLLIEAKTLLDQVTEIQQGLQKLNNLQQGELILGASQTIGNYWLPNFIDQFKKHHPDIQVKCTLGNSQEILTSAASGEIDLGLVEGDTELSHAIYLEQQVVGTDHLEVIVGPSHPWFQSKTVLVTDLLTTQWVMREKESGTRQQFEDALQAWGLNPTKLNIALEINSNEMVKASVEKGLGASVMSELTIVRELKLGMLRSVCITNCDGSGLLSQIHRPFYLIKHRERFHNQASQSFERILKSTYCNTKDLAQIL